MIAKVKELNKNDFGRYGLVLDLKDAELSSTSEFHDYWDGVAEFHPEGTCICSFLRIRKSTLMPVEEMECHYKTEEILFALNGDIVINVALADAAGKLPDESSISSFHVKQGTGVILRPGIWHSLPCTVSPGSSMTLVIFRKNTSYSRDKNAETDIHFAKLENSFLLQL